MIRDIYITFFDGWHIHNGQWELIRNGKVVKIENYFGYYRIDKFLKNFIVDKKSIGIDLSWKDKI